MAEPVSCKIIGLDLEPLEMSDIRIILLTDVEEVRTAQVHVPACPVSLTVRAHDLKSEGLVFESRSGGW